MKANVFLVAVLSTTCFAGGWITGTCIPTEYPEADTYAILTYDQETYALVDSEYLDVGDIYLTVELHRGYYYQWCRIFDDGDFLSQLGKLNLFVTPGDTLKSNYFSGFYSNGPYPIMGLFESTWGLIKAISCE
jgi:hypothetical protein